MRLIEDIEFIVAHRGTDPPEEPQAGKRYLSMIEGALTRLADLDELVADDSNRAALASMEGGQ